MSQENKSLTQQVQTKGKVEIAQKVVLGVGMLCAFLTLINFALLFASGLNKLQTSSSANLGETRTLFTISTNETFSTLFLNKTFTQDTSIPLNLQKTIIAISASGSVKLNKPDSYARVILVDSENNRYLLYSTDELITNNDYAFSNYCEETCHVGQIKPTSLQIQIYEAQLNVTSLYYLIEGQNLTKTAEQIKDEQYQDKINRLNEAIKTKGLHWVAGDTQVSRLLFTEKEKFYNGRLPNTCGYLYYKGGIFEECESVSSLLNQQTFSPRRIDFDPENPFNFVWTDRHDQNWMTVTKNQNQPYICGSCWAHADIGVVESIINLYYNQHLDKDLSEQDLVSCSGQGSCSGGWVAGALNYIEDTGVVDEMCFPYTAQNTACSERCDDWQNRLWKISSFIDFGTDYTELEIKNAIIEKGPLVRSNPSHANVLAGFGEIVPNMFVFKDYPPYTAIIYPNDPLVGTTYWWIRESSGPDWGYGGYAYYVFASNTFNDDRLYYTVNIPVIPPTSEPAHSIACVDSDNDSYCWWGISTDKPTSCPTSCSEQNAPDCDDSDDTTGACPENYICGSYQMLQSGETEPFGDYGYFSQLSCCGDNLGEYDVQGVCCNTSPNYTVIEEQEMGHYNFDSVFGSFGFSNSPSDAVSAGLFNSPRGVASGNDKIFVVDSSNNRIQVFDLNGTFIFTFGSSGTGNGQFSSPKDIAVSAERIYVTDTNNHRIQIFDQEGNFISSFGTYGTGNTQFKFPNGIDVTNDKIYVADTYNHRIKIFDLDGNYISNFGGFGYNEGDLNNPYDVAVIDEKIIVADTFNKRVQIFDINGNYLDQFGSAGSGNGQFNNPRGLVAKNNMIYVADSSNNRVQIFDINGNYLDQFGSAGSGNGQFNNPYGIGIGDNNNLYIADTLNHRIQILTPQTSPICVFSSPPISPAPKAGSNINGL